MMQDVVFSDHALSEMARRGVTEATVRRVLNAPQTMASVRAGRIVAQGTEVDIDTGKTFLIRVFVDVNRVPPVVVTAYRTSKLAKYGGGS
jgi:hypothetical protein